MPNKLLKELQAKFKSAEIESKAPEEEHEKIQPDSMETNEDSETIGMPPTLTTQDSSNEVTNLSRVSFLSVNIYHHNNQYKIYPLSDITKDEKKNHVDLLYLKDNKGNSHYCLIKNLWKLV